MVSAAAAENAEELEEEEDIAGEEPGVATVGSSEGSGVASMDQSSSAKRSNIDFPVPGSPIIIMCLRCSAAFRITTEPAS